MTAPEPGDIVEVDGTRVVRVWVLMSTNPTDDEILAATTLAEDHLGRDSAETVLHHGTHATTAEVMFT